MIQSTGGNNLKNDNINTMEDDLEVFLNRIDEYIKNKDLAAPVYLDEHREGELLTMEQIKELTGDECFSLALGLCAYLDHVISQRSKQENAIKYCTYNINAIVARHYSDVEGVYAPYDLKEQIIVRNNILATRLEKFRLIAETRITSLKSKEFNLRKKIDLLNEKGKRL